MLNPLGTRVINTDRFILRPFNIRDAYSMFYFYLGDPNVCEFLEFEPYKNVNEVIDVINIYLQRYSDPFYFHWAIEDKSNGYVIGSVSIHSIDHDSKKCEIGICLSKLYWKKGVGKEVISKIIEYAQKYVGLSDIYAYFMEGNDNSRHLLESLGMKKHPQLDTYMFKKGERKMLHCYKLK